MYGATGILVLQFLTIFSIHKSYFDSYYNKVKRDKDFDNFSIIEERSIISDPLHILKRAHYRLFTENIHAGFFMNSLKLDFDSLREILDVPELVFSNKKNTKMQDSLPIYLFSL